MLFIDIFKNCIDECLLKNYSSTFVWMAVHKHIRILDKNSSSFFHHQKINFLFIVDTIKTLLEHNRAEKSSLKYDFETEYMSGVEIVLNSMVLQKKIENTAFVQQLLTGIRSKL